MHDFAKILKSNKGEEMVEAAIALPAVILIALLMLRVFTFYLEILNAGIKEHEKAVEAWSKFKGAGISEYRTERKINLMPGGFLQNAGTKKIETKAYLINEDVIVRAGAIVK